MYVYGNKNNKDDIDKLIIIIKVHKKYSLYFLLIFRLNRRILYVEYRSTALPSLIKMKLMHTATIIIKQFVALPK